MRVTQNRLDLMTIETLDDIKEKDPLSVNFRDFETVRKTNRIQVAQVNVSRPYMMAYSVYGSVLYWWFICEVAGTIDPYGMIEGDMLVAPNVLDYYDWYRAQKALVE
jgi:hypothetical protein